MDKLTAMQCFVRAVETGSFSAVGRELGIGQPSVSRYIDSLEQDLGTKLIQRTTRKLNVTHEGRRYYEQARVALDLIVQAESAARGQQNPQGLLRVTCSPALGIEKIVGSMASFMANYPNVQLELMLSEAYSDLIAEGVDVAIRGGLLSDSTLHARLLGHSERVYVASNTYLDVRGLPKIPADLSNYECILYSNKEHENIWSFVGGDVRVQGRMRINNLAGIRQAALEGFGIAYLPSWMIWDHVKSGSLQVVLPAHTRAPTPVNAVYAAHRLLPQRAIVFMDHIATVFSTMPGMNGTLLLG